MLLQKRSLDKYHCGGLWTNTVCSHPAPKESYEDAAARRLKEEFGFETELHKVFEFTYKAEFDNELAENEYDRTFVGRYDGETKPDPNEISGYKWISYTDLKKDLKNNPKKYTEWFKAILKRLDPKKVNSILNI